MKQPKARIHVVHIYPRRNAIDRVDKVNAAADRLLESSGLTNYDFVDAKPVLTKADGTLDKSLFRDGLHPNEEGYRRIAEVYRKYIQDQSPYNSLRLAEPLGTGASGSSIVESTVLATFLVMLVSRKRIWSANVSTIESAISCLCPSNLKAL